MSKLCTCIRYIYYHRLIVCFDSLRPSQHFFSHVGKGLPGLNQYEAVDKVSCSRTQCSASGEAQTNIPLSPYKHAQGHNIVPLVRLKPPPLFLHTSTLPLSYFLMPPFHQGLFCKIDPIWTRLSPINQIFDPPDCRPESPPIVSPFLTRLSPYYINASNRCRKLAMIKCWACFCSIRFVLQGHSKMLLHSEICRVQKYAG